MRFTAKRSTAYYLWIRMRAQSNSNANDSIHVQFSDSVDARVSRRSGSGRRARPRCCCRMDRAAARRGDGDGPTTAGISWSPSTLRADGAHVVRIQQREDGAEIDQVVLSPVTFASSAPGTFQVRHKNSAAGVEARTERVGRDVGHQSRGGCRRPDLRDAGRRSPTLPPPARRRFATRTQVPPRSRQR